MALRYRRRLNLSLQQGFRRAHRARAQQRKQSGVLLTDARFLTHGGLKRNGGLLSEMRVLGESTEQTENYGTTGKTSRISVCSVIFRLFRTLSSCPLAT